MVCLDDRGSLGFLDFPDRLFYGCSSLKTVLLPDSNTTIRQDVFYNCPITTFDAPDIRLEDLLTLAEYWGLGVGDNGKHRVTVNY